MIAETPQPTARGTALGRYVVHSLLGQATWAKSIDGRNSQVVEMRFFGGLSVEETAEVLHASPDTIERNWRLGKLWLLREIEREGA